MEIDQLLETVRAFDGVLDLAPGEGTDFPEIAWGDHFLYYAPDGQVPQHSQPYATIVTKDYPDDTDSHLDAPDRWRVNVHVGTDRFVDLTGETPKSGSRSWDRAAADVVFPHPVYRAQGWVSVVNPDERTGALVVSLLREAHDAAQQREERRHSS